MKNEVVIKLLGGFSLAIEGQAVEIASKNAAAVLCWLLIEQTSVSRDRLSSLLWGDASRDKARQSLRQVLADLRKILTTKGAALVAHQDQISLAAPEWNVDLWRLTQFAEKSDLASLQRGFQLCGGPLLDGFEVRSAGFDDWLSMQRRSVVNLGQRLCRKLIDEYDQQPEMAIPVAERLVALEPLNEAAHRELMALFIQCDSDERALTQYKLCCSILESELGITPTAQTTDMYEDLLRIRKRQPSVVIAESDSSSLQSVTVLALQPKIEDEDPEQFELSLRKTLDRAQEIARRYGGKLRTVTPGIGLFFFGLERVRGAEVDRAIFTAKSILLEFPAACIGISFGQILVRSNEPPSGKAVVEASSLAQNAKPGSYQVSEAATNNRQLRESVRVGSLVGRNYELRQFVSLMDSCVETNTSATILVRGEAGIGKTRLLHECSALAKAEGFNVAQAQILDFGTLPAGDSLSQIVSQLVSENPDELERFLPLELLPIARHMLGMPLNPNERQRVAELDNEQHSATRADVCIKLAIEASKQAPLLLVIEDIHWASEYVFRATAPFIQQLRDHPVLLVLTSRFEGSALDPNWRNMLADVRLVTLDLQPLTPKDSANLLQSLAVHERWFDTLIERSAGNPLFLEELARTSTPELVPGKVQHLVAARLDALPDEQRSAVQLASVLGQHFQNEIFSKVSSVQLDAAKLAGLLWHKSGSWQFQHDLVREGVYRTLLSADRKKYHRMAAECLQKSDPAMSAEHWLLTDSDSAPAALYRAAIYERDQFRVIRALNFAKRIDVRKAPELAIARYQLLGELHLSMGDANEAIEYFDCALSDTQSGAGYLGRGMAYNLLDQADRAIESLNLAVEFSDSIAEKADAHFQLGNAFFPTGRLDECLAAHTESLKLSNELGSTFSAARAHGGLGDAQYQRGRMVSALASYTKCVEIATQHEHHVLVAANLAMQGLVQMFNNDVNKGIVTSKSALEHSRARGNVRAELLAQNVLGLIYFFNGEYAVALQHCDAGWQLAQQLRSTRFLLDAHAQKAHILIFLDQSQAAAEVYGRARAMLTPELTPFGGAYICGIGALLASTWEQANALLAEGSKMLSDNALSHSHIFYYLCAIDACLKFSSLDQIEFYSTQLLRYHGQEMCPLSNLVVDRARLLLRWHSGDHDKQAKEAIDSLFQAASLAGQGMLADGLKITGPE